MTTIRYTPITGGQTFGNPGDLFEGAAKSLDKATSGLGKAFDTVRKGSIEARDTRTQDAITALKSNLTPEEYAGSADLFSNQAALQQQFGGAVDFNKIAAAQQTQRGVVDANVTKQFNLDKTRATQADAPLLKQLGSSLFGKTSEEIAGIASQFDPSSFANPLEAQKMIQAASRTAEANVDRIYTREQQQISQAETALTQGKLQSARDLLQNESLNLAPGDVDTPEAYNARELELSNVMKQYRSSGNYTASELNKIESDFRQNTGLSPSNEAELIFQNLPKTPDGKIPKDTFYKLLAKENIPREVGKNIISSYKDISGATKRETEALYQQRRQEKLDDALTKESSPASLQKYIVDTFTDTDFKHPDALDEANAHVDKARAAGMPNNLIMQAVFAGTQIRGDFGS